MLSPGENDRLDAEVFRLERKSKFLLYRELEAESRKEWLVQGLLGAGDASAVYGVPGCGKSVLVEDLALHVAAGREWHGRPGQQGAVLYVALERKKLVERRAIAFREHHAIPDAPFAIIGGVFDFRNSQTVATVLETARQVEDETGDRLALVVIDTISRALCGGDENSPKDMGAIVAATSRIQVETKAHVLWVHHMPQDGAGRLRGHGALLGAMDTTIYVETLSGEARSATVIKANDSEEGERVAFKLESVPIGEGTTAPVVIPAEPAGPAQTDGPRLTKNQQTMFSILHGAGPAGLTTEQWNQQARTVDIGTKRKADSYDIRTALKSKGLVRQYGERWNIC
jgi:RecA-family ATPase